MLFFGGCVCYCLIFEEKCWGMGFSDIGVLVFFWSFFFRWGFFYSLRF